jgi:transposase InsO family protein
MKRKRLSSEQIMAVLKQAELGMPACLCGPQVGISKRTFYRRRKQYASIQSGEVRKLGVPVVLRRTAAAALEIAEATEDGGDPGGDDRVGKTKRRLEYGSVADHLADGAKFCTLTIVNVFTKEALAIEVGQRLNGEHVMSALNRIAGRLRYRAASVCRQRQRNIRVPARHVHVSLPRKKSDLAGPASRRTRHIETSNGSFRDECLNPHWFETLGEAKAIVEAWRRDYKESRPHSALKELAPAEFARQLAPSSPETPENSLQIWSGKPHADQSQDIRSVNRALSCYA